MYILFIFSGVAFVYKQDFFNNLYEEFGIALENIVYYKVSFIINILNKIRSEIKIFFDEKLEKNQIVLDIYPTLGQNGPFLTKL